MTARFSFPLLSILPLLASCIVACSDTVAPADEGSGRDALSGGATTVFDLTSNAFSMPAPNLTGDALGRHMEGDAAFEATFVTAPAPVHGGLGPVFNNTSCVSCHPRDGRGRPPQPGEPFSSMLFRISIPGSGPNGGPRAVPGFGGQLQDRAVYGVQPEGRVAIGHVELPGQFAEGTGYSLLRPTYSIVSSYAPIPDGMMLSPRVAPPVFGLGLLEAVPESAIMAHADENDGDGDGISGRINRVWDPERGTTAMGRFGWKAGAPTLQVQVAGAYNEDMGITSPLFKLESCFDQPQYSSAISEYDLADHVIESTTYYTRTLAVPARRSTNDPRVKLGATVFESAKCSSCHLPTLATGSSPFPELAAQTIHPYTDLLLHDMGDELADGRPDFLASGSEWRTPPLWGIGLTRIVNGHTSFLHDGRARNLLEAIMWHGGEAKGSREYVRNLGINERNALVAFLESL